MNKPKVVILGAGYGGLITCKSLEKLLKPGEADIVLINKHHYHYLTTQLHKIGAGTADDRKIAMDIPDLIDHDKTEFKRAKVSSIDRVKQDVNLANGEIIHYDYLLIALGFEVATYGIPGIKENAFEIRSFKSSKAIYHQILKQFTAYKADHDPARLTFVVAGGGFTGIEMLGELAEIMPQLCNKFGVPFEAVKIIVVEAAASLLPFFGEKSIKYTTEFLEKNHIKVITNTKILECTPDEVRLENLPAIPTKTLIWSCGVQANSAVQNFGIPLVRGGKIPVNSYLQVENMSNVFCIGDCSYFTVNEKSSLPSTAQVALQEAAVCAKNIMALIRGESLQPFVYHHKGFVASMGKWAGVGQVGNLRLSGLIGAFMKQVIEARYLLMLGGPALFLKQHFWVNHQNHKVTVHHH